MSNVPGVGVSNSGTFTAPLAQPLDAVQSDVRQGMGPVEGAVRTREMAFIACGVAAVYLPLSFVRTGDLHIYLFPWLLPSTPI